MEWHRRRFRRCAAVVLPHVGELGGAVRALRAGAGGVARAGASGEAAASIGDFCRANGGLVAEVRGVAGISEDGLAMLALAWGYIAAQVEYAGQV